MMSFHHRNELNPDQEALPFGGKGDIFAEANEETEIRVRAGGYSPAPAHRIRNDVRVENLKIFLKLPKQVEHFHVVFIPTAPG